MKTNKEETMTSHHDVAGVVASASGYRGDKTIVERLREDQPSLNRVHQDRKDAALALESQAKALSEWKQAASVEAGLRREFYDRALAAEARLAEAMRVIELFAQEADPWIKWRDEFKVDQHELNRNHARVPVPAVLAARAFTEAAKEKT